MRSPSDPVTVREARREDAGRIHDMLEQLAASIGKPGGILGTPDDIARFGFGEAPLFSALIAWQGEAPVGLSLFFAEYSSWRGRPGVYVQDLFVAPQCRGLGLGGILLAEAARRAHALGGTYLRLSVDRTNEAAAGFYNRAGFRHADEERIFTLDGEAFAGRIEREPE